MNHQPLPWRITEATEKKGREIVDAKGGTVAKLTALDLPNAELIVSSVNAGESVSIPIGPVISFDRKESEEMKLINHPAEFLIGREYWLRSKVTKSIYKATCEERLGIPYFEGRSHPGDSESIFYYWVVVGPLPIVSPPDFDALIEANKAG